MIYKTTSLEVVPTTLATCSSYDCELRPMTLTFVADLDRVKLNEHAKYVGQRSFSSKVIVGHTNTHRTDC